MIENANCLTVDRRLDIFYLLDYVAGTEVGNRKKIKIKIK